jgi:hypothetical protein
MIIPQAHFHAARHAELRDRTIGGVRNSSRDRNIVSKQNDVAKEAIGHGVRGKRSKSGAVSFPPQSRPPMNRSTTDLDHVLGRPPSSAVT